MTDSVLFRCEECGSVSGDRYKITVDNQGPKHVCKMCLISTMTLAWARSTGVMNDLYVKVLELEEQVKELQDDMINVKRSLCL